jgi:hypothetical protein
VTRATYASWFDARTTPDLVPWDLDGPQGPVANAVYLGEVFHRVEDEITRRDPALGAKLDRLTVVVTPNPAVLPRTGPDVVAILTSDNWARVPRWADDVALVLATNRGRRFADATRMLPRTLGWAEVLDETRVRVERARWARRGHRPALRPGAIIPMPLGFAHQREVPPVPWEERTIDAYFAGSMVQVLDRGGALRRKLRTGGFSVKSLHRNRMLEAAERLRAERPDLTVQIDLVTSDTAGDHADTYSQDMARTRFSLDPRGTSRETYRFFEAARVGAVPVVTALPAGGLYAGAPVLRLRHWSDLPAAMRRMREHPDEARALHEAAKEWYARRGSPEATAERIAPLVEEVLRRLP